jgi:transcriptional regulator with XRE-family HTH domain
MTKERDRWLDYGTAIERLREDHRLTREALAEAAGISHSYLYEVERGLKRPSTDVLAKIAAALGMRPSEMLEYIESRTPHGPAEPLQPSPIIASPSVRRNRTMAARVMAVSPDAPSSASERSALQMLLDVARELSDRDVESLLALARRLAEKDR